MVAGLTDERIEAVQPALTEEEFRVYCKGSDKRPRDVVLDAPLQMIAKATGWQGLTDAEIEGFENMELGTHDLCLEIEAKLEKKNG